MASVDMNGRCGHDWPGSKKGAFCGETALKPKLMLVTVFPQNFYQYLLLGQRFTYQIIEGDIRTQQPR